MKKYCFLLCVEVSVVTSDQMTLVKIMIIKLPVQDQELQQELRTGTEQLSSARLEGVNVKAPPRGRKATFTMNDLLHQYTTLTEPTF